MGKYSVPSKNMEIWEKRARSQVAINSYADLFSSAAYQCLQQESMSVNALFRLLEAVVKSVKHAMAMSTILDIELMVNGYFFYNIYIFLFGYNKIV